MFRASLVIAFTVLACQGLLAQQSAATNSPSSCTPSEAYRAGGWRIPGLAGSQEKMIKSKQIELPGILPPPTRVVARAAFTNIPGVFATQLEPGNSDLELAWPHCSRFFLGWWMVDDITRITRIQELWKLDFNGKVFAYGLVYLVKSFPDSLGTVGQVIFYDVDGKGIFTVAKKPKLDIFASIEVPKWAKEEVSGAGH